MVSTVGAPQLTGAAGLRMIAAAEIAPEIDSTIPRITTATRTILLDIMCVPPLLPDTLRSAYVAHLAWSPSDPAHRSPPLMWPRPGRGPAEGFSICLTQLVCAQ